MKSVPLVEKTRSGYVESIHRGSFVVLQRGKILKSIGDPTLIVPERSTAKPFQLTALLKHGGRRHFNLTKKEIAIMASSHNGEREHVDTIHKIFEKGDIDINLLNCGVHPPFHYWITEEIYNETKKGPQPIHNNCSGKHAAMLLLCKLLKVPFEGYNDFLHPVQQAIAKEVAKSLSTDTESLKVGVDGCGVPTYFVSLMDLASAYCKLASAKTTNGNRELYEVKNAMISHPFMVAGSMRADTDIMNLKPIVAKAGAQAVYCMAIPELEIGISIKIESGCEDSSESVAVEILRRLNFLNDQELNQLEKYWRRPIYDCTGNVVGRLRTIF